MYLNTQEKSECCGCGACSEICPKKCIKMEKDRYGYIYPIVDRSKCINCKLCEKVCPFNSKNKERERLDNNIIYALKHKEENEILKASSGGAFGAIVYCLRNKGNVNVWGAAFDSNLNVKHICSFDENDLNPIHKSKYIQSDMTKSFKEIRDQLNKGEKVLFSGTPCQVSALYNFLNNKEYDNLFTLDLVCHGVPNQEMFDKYILEKEKKLKDKIVIYQFREKEKKGNKWNSKKVYIKTAKGKVLIEDRFKNQYLRAFQSALINRESCYKCIFANPKRTGDITIGDFWGIEKFVDNLNVNHGVSLIKINSNKGLQIIEDLKKICDLYEIDSVKYLNITRGAMKQSSSPNKKRGKFLKVYEKRGFIKAIDSTVYGFIERIKCNINPDVKRKIKKVLRKG